MVLRCLALCFLASADACTNLLVTPTASADGSSMVAYNADSAALHGALSHWKGGPHPAGAMRDVYSWDLGKYLGSIPEVEKTYNVMGNANCQGLVIGETTLGGLSELSNVGKDYRNGTILDYGQLIWITLQRAATAREAIDVMADLTAKYGYASDMEGFSITDPSGEVWYMELIGKGGFEKGALHVAKRVPEGHVIAHANQARITTFLPCDDPSQCKASPDVVSFAIKHGYWTGSATDPSFSFSDVYDPLTFSGARFCEARVWHIFRSLADATEFDADYYQPYAAGYNLTRRMPLSVKPKAKLTLDAMHKLMSHHFEGSWFDPSTDVGAGAELSPYRWNGLEWESNGQSYVNERIVGTRKIVQCTSKQRLGRLGRLEDLRAVAPFFLRSLTCCCVRVLRACPACVSCVHVLLACVHRLHRVAFCSSGPAGAGAKASRSPAALGRGRPQLVAEDPDSWWRQRGARFV
jgi:dipeptidase